MPESSGNLQEGSDADSAAAVRLRRVEAIYFEVALLAPGDQDAAISRLSSGDNGIEAEVRALLDSARKIGGFLDEPALGRGIDQLTSQSQADPLADPLIGVVLGAFRVQERIASGGMGTVYKAHRTDGQFEQSVAIKVVKRGLDSEQIIERFTRERRTLASLDHPYIARLLEGGVTPDGRPFLVMEYVEGLEIDEYCDRRGLTIRQRLELMAEVCKAVHHAHQNLVIHRDIKPGNILVTAQGVPKLLDFGIAKLLSGEDAPTLTAESDRRLTPEYASPEQVAGESITTASDVYSLGVVLYELLTGARPYRFTSRSTEELRRIVCGTMPPAPSAAVTTQAARQSQDGREQSAVSIPRTRGVSSTRLKRSLRGDLDNLVLMALRKEPRRRYLSAEQFAQDIKRFLDGMPVQARRDTTIYRASKFVRRHALGVTVTSLAVAAIALSAAGLFLQAKELERQRDVLAAANRRLDEGRRFMQAVLSGAETGNQGPDARLGSVILDAVAALKANPPADPATRAAAEQSLGRAVMSLGMLAEARPLLEKARDGFASVVGDADARTSVHIDLAELLFFEGKHAQAQAELESLLGMERRKLGGTHSEREGLILNDLGAAHRAQGRFQEAADLQREAITVRTLLLGERSLPVAESQNNLASALFQLDKIDEAIAEFERSITTRKALLRENHPLIVRAHANLGLALLRAHKPEQAVQVLTSAAEAWDIAFGPEHAGRVATVTSLAQALRALKRFDEAVARLEAVLTWQRVRFAADSPQVAATLANIGIALAESGDDQNAKARLEPSISVLQSAGKPFAGIATSAREVLLGIYERAGDLEKARQLRKGASPAP